MDRNNKMTNNFQHILKKIAFGNLIFNVCVKECVFSHTRGCVLNMYIWTPHRTRIYKLKTYIRVGGTCGVMMMMMMLAAHCGTRARTFSDGKVFGSVYIYICNCLIYDNAFNGEM